MPWAAAAVMAQHTAIVLGGGRPFGAEIVARLTVEGFAVRAADPADEWIERAFADIERLDLLVFNAPVQPDGTRFADITDAAFLDALQDQVFDLHEAGQLAAARMQAGGCIVHVASRAHLGAWGGAHYMAAGAALVGMSRSMALELAACGIRVNVLAPDFIGSERDTEQARAEVAGAVAFLAGQDSALLTGQTLLLDQAHSLRMPESARR